jgi:hypothetical protein
MDADARTLEFRTKLGFLLVLVGTNSTARQRTNSGADQGMLAPFYCVITGHQTDNRTDTGANQRTLGRLAGLLFTRIGVERRATADKDRHHGHCENNFSRSLVHDLPSGLHGYCEL